MPVAEHDVYYLEIVTEDVDRTRAFYSSLHGWSFGEAQADLGRAVVAVLPDGFGCGTRAPMSPQEQPTVCTYLRVGDVI